MPNLNSTAVSGPLRIFQLLFIFQQWLPVIMIWAIIISSYYVFIVELCIHSIQNQTARVMILLVGHALYIVLCVSFVRAIIAKIPTPPKEFYLQAEATTELMLETNEDRSVELLNTHARTLPVLCRLPNGIVRFCHTCMCVKPDRCHHCSTCRTCILRMDHHCPWINNCVHFNNYKYFILTVFWGLVSSIYLGAASSKFFVQYWSVKNGSEVSNVTRACIIYMFLMAVVMVVSLTSLLGFHIFLIVRNRTTLENYRPPSFPNGPQRRGFDLGISNNVKSVMGPFNYAFLLPIHSWPGDGVHFEPRFPSIDSQI